MVFAIMNFMGMQTLKIISYTISKRLQGYHLLKNSKEAPSSYVRMIKHFNYISNKLNQVDYYERITKDFSFKEPVTEEYLTTTKIPSFDNITNKITYKNRNASYDRFCPPSKSLSSYKNEFKEEELHLWLDKVVKTENTIGINPLFAFIGPFPEEKTIKYTIRDMEQNKFYKKEGQKFENRLKSYKNFFTTLWHNLVK